MNLLLARDLDLTAALPACLAAFTRQIEQFRVAGERWRQIRCLAEWYACFACLEAPFATLRPALEAFVGAPPSAGACFGVWCLFTFLCTAFLNTEEENAQVWCHLVDRSLSELLEPQRRSSDLCCAEATEGIELALQGVVEVVRVNPTLPEGAAENGSFFTLRGQFASRPLVSRRLLQTFFLLAESQRLASCLSLLSFFEFSPFAFASFSSLSSFLHLHLQLCVFSEEREDDSSSFRPLDVQWFLSLSHDHPPNGDPFCEAVIPAVNALTEAFPSLYLVSLNDRTDDTWCDFISPDWASVLALRFKAPPATTTPATFSFSFSSPAAAPDTAFFMPSASLLSTLTSLLFANTPNTVDAAYHRIEAVLSALQAVTSETPTNETVTNDNTNETVTNSIINETVTNDITTAAHSTPTSFLSYSLFVALLSRCFLLHLPFCTPTTLTTDPLATVAQIAPIASLPSFLLFPFLLPLYTSSIAFSSLSHDTQVALLRSLPLLSLHSPSLSSPLLRECSIARQQLLFFLCRSNHAFSSVSFPCLVAALSGYCAHAPTPKETAVEMAERVAKQPALARCLLLYTLVHATSLPESVYELLVGVVKNVAVRAESLFMECLFPADAMHYCREASGVIHVLCAFDSVTFARMVTASNEVLTLFLRHVLCSVHCCVGANATLRCECGNCQETLQPEATVLREYVTRLQERLTQNLRSIAKTPMVKTHPLFSLVREHFDLWLVCCRRMVGITNTTTCRSQPYPRWASTDQAGKCYEACSSQTQRKAACDRTSSPETASAPSRSRSSTHQRASSSPSRQPSRSSPHDPVSSPPLPSSPS